MDDAEKVREMRKLMHEAHAEVARMRECFNQLTAILAMYAGGEAAREIAKAIDEKTEKRN